VNFNSSQNRISFKVTLKQLPMIAQHNNLATLFLFVSKQVFKNCQQLSFRAFFTQDLAKIHLRSEQKSMQT